MIHIKKELMELLSLIADEAKKPQKDVRKSVIKISIETLGTLVSAVPGIQKIWESAKSVIHTYFHSN